MKIVTLNPFLAETVFALGLKDSLVGVSHRSQYPEEIKEISVVTRERGQKKNVPGIEGELCVDLVDVPALQSLKPDLIISRVPNPDPQKISDLSSEINREISESTRLLHYDPRSLDQILEMFEELAKKLKVPSAGTDLSGRVRAQAKDWVDNFYPRTRGKKVCMLVGTEPLMLGGFWLPQMIQMTSAQAHHPLTGEKHKKVDWQEILQYRPDVLIVAPHGTDLKGSMSRLQFFESLPGWEDIPAVKRGEVIFCDGTKHFHNPGPRIIETFGVLVSAIAGLESGYITERGVFQRLRWVEMHRHEI